jgi:hypothetical protein
MDVDKLVCKSSYLDTPLWLSLFTIVGAIVMMYVLRGGTFLIVLAGALFLTVAALNHVLYKYVYFSRMEISGNEVLFSKGNGASKQLPLSELHTIRRLRGGFLVHFEFRNELIKSHVYMDSRVASEIASRRSRYLQGLKLGYYHNLLGSVRYL